MVSHWITENSGDGLMLDRSDVYPIPEAYAAGKEKVVVQIQRHNKAVRKLVERFFVLNNDRKRMLEPYLWRDIDADTIAAEKRRVTTEAWNVLVEFRRLLKERAEMLRRAVMRLNAQEKQLIRQIHDASESEGDDLAPVKKKIDELTRMITTAQNRQRTAECESDVLWRMGKAFELLG